MIYSRNNKGFSLVEIMVAVAILAVATGSLLVSRNDAIRSAGNAIEMRRMQKLFELQMGKIAAGLEKKDSGNFEDIGYAKYRWHVSVEKIPVVINSKTSQHQLFIKKVTLKIEKNSREKYSQVLVAYFPIEGQ